MIFRYSIYVVLASTILTDFYLAIILHSLLTFSLIKCLYPVETTLHTVEIKIFCSVLIIIINFAFLFYFLTENLCNSWYKPTTGKPFVLSAYSLFKNSITRCRIIRIWGILVSYSRTPKTRICQEFADTAAT